jgi:transposase
VVAATVINTTGSGYQALLDFALAHAPGPRLLWAVEGTRSYGIGLVRFLHTHGQLVVEVDHPRRPARRGGKSDTLDAIGAAREVLARPTRPSHARMATGKACGCCWSPATAPSPAAPPRSTASRRWCSPPRPRL